MKKLSYAFKGFISILKSESYLLITTKGIDYGCDGAINPSDYQYIVNDVWDNMNGQESALNEFKKMLQD